MKAVAGGDHADHNLEVLAGLLGADTDSVDLDTLFDAVQAVAREGQDSLGSAGQPAGVMDVATDDSEGSLARIIDDGTPGSIYDKLVDTSLGDFDGLKLDGLIDIFGTDT
ncbi:MAG: hypothetical protein IID50_11330 [Proteobacteria bacterium]|nr:hypothetical protein [Pseudomonadota bacterium]